MSILFEPSNTSSEPTEIFDDMDVHHSVGDQLFYWALMLLSASITVFAFWKLIDVLIRSN